MTVGLNRASVFAVVEESTAGEYAEPTTGSQYIPLRPGNELQFDPEKLENDELLNDIGAAKSSIGKEKLKGKHSGYMKHSGVEGQEPQVGVIYKSIFGSRTVSAVEYVTVGGSTVAIVNVADGTQFQVGQALLGKDGVNGYFIRNIKQIVGNALHLNFNLENAPAAGIGLGKAIVYVPTAQGHPTFSTTKNVGNGHARECSSGDTTTELSITADANGYAQFEASYEGTKYLFNPIVIDATNKYLDLIDDGGTIAVTVLEKVYRTPIELADAIAAALNSSSAETYTVVYSSVTGKFTIASSTSAVLSLLFLTGVNTANTIATALGYTVTDKTGALTYTSQNEQSYVASVSPSFDNTDLIVLKGAELMIGDSTDNIKVASQSVKITVSKEVEDVDDMCEETGVSEKIAVGRVAKMAVTMTLKKHKADLLETMLNNGDIRAMLNAGPKLGGNWIAGKCFNFYLHSGTVTAFKTAGDSFVQAELELTGFVNTSAKDAYMNFV